MKPQCIDMVQAAARAAGREKPLTDGQLADIDSRLARTMRQLARTEADWQSLSADQRLGMAAERALEDIAAEAKRKVVNAQLQIVKTAATEQRIGDLLRLHEGDKRAHALVHDIDATGKTIQGIKMESMGRLMALMDAVTSSEGAGIGRRVGMFLFDADNPQMTRDLAAEVFRNADGSTGNKVAQEGAKAWLQTIEELRTRFNGAGGDVGRLDYGYLPQPHDSAKVRAAGADAWVARMLPLLDRSRYVDEAGARLDDAAVSRILGGVWETIATDGINKQEPGAYKGTGARANRGSEHRELHFKDAEAFLGYLREFGAGSMYDAMVGHVGRMARDIGLVERYGPNPNAQMRLQMDLAAKADGTQADNLPRTFGLRPESYWDSINGNASSPASARLAQIGTDMRNVQTFGKLGSAVISSITDLGTYIVSAGYNKLGYWRAIGNIGRVASSGEARDFLTTHGIIAESMIGDLNRWTGENIKQTWSGRLAQSTMKLSLMNAWTDTLRRAFSLTMMQGLARLSKTEWSALGEWDRTHLERAGITEADWQVITRAELTEFGGREHLTPEAIRATGDERANEIVAKVLGLVQDESEYAVLNPDLATKALASGGGSQRGTVRGELARSVMQFKSFPIAMVSRHWRRMLDAPKVDDGSAPMLANRLLYSGAMMLTTTALGAIALQAKQVVAGKDPIDMRGDHATKFWLRAVAQGGGLSIVGDTLLNDPGDSPGDYAANAIKTAAGPAIGTVGDAVLKVGAGNVWKAAEGKKTHAAADALNLVRSNAPYLNLWYAKAAIDHAGMHAVQENLSPGYLGKMQQRAAKDWGQSFWYPPGTGLPQRAPDVGAAVGR
jgi:hypothetical protein